MNYIVGSLPSLFLGTLCLAVSSCAYFPESTFKLAQESRLPKWFTLPAGLGRSDVTVRMDNYVESSGRTAIFTLLDLNGRTLSEVKGTLRGMEPLKLRNSPGGNPEGYPSFELVTANGVTEIVEHRRREPIFYINSDPSVLAELGG